MSHMVIYRGADGKPGYHQTEEIIDAVAFVERLRNEQAVEHARIFRLEEVQFEFRPYYRVELTAGTSSPPLGAAERRFVAAPQPEADPEPLPEASSAWPGNVAGGPTTGGSYQAPSDGVEVDTSIGARRGLFGR